MGADLVFLAVVVGGACGLAAFSRWSYARTKTLDGTPARSCARRHRLAAEGE